MTKKILTILSFLFIQLSHAQPVSLHWATSFSGIDDAQGTAVAVDVYGYVYTCGTFNGTVDFDPGPGDFSLVSVGNTDIYLTKSDAYGNLVWAGRMGGANNDYSLALALDHAQNVILTGYFQGAADFDPGVGNYVLNSFGGNDVFVAKFNPSGMLMWAFNVGGELNERANSICIDTIGNIYLTGEFQGIALFDNGPTAKTLVSAGGSDIFIAKYNAAGLYQWAVSMGGAVDDAANDIALDAAGNVYATGWFADVADFDPGAGVYNLGTSSSISNWRVFVLKLSTYGTFDWAGQFAGSGIQQGFSIAVDSLKNVYVAGSFSGATDFDPGADTFLLATVGLKDVFLTKLNPAGDFLWAKQLGSQTDETCLALALDDSCNVYSIGTFSDTLNFDPGQAVFYLSPAGFEDVFISKLDSAGKFMWANAVGGQDTEEGKAIVVDKAYNVYVTGYFRDVADFDPGVGGFFLSSDGGNESFVLKLYQGEVSGISSMQSHSLVAFPNPAKQKFSVHADNIFADASAKLFDLTGNLVLQQSHLFGPGICFDIAGLSKGLYFLEIADQGKTFRIKVMKD